MERVQAGIRPETQDIAHARWPRLPLEIRGFGHVKAAGAEAAARRRAELLAAFEAGGWPRQAHAAE
jgi:indolepyruvate ferredoxin oxidoreductase